MMLLLFFCFNLLAQEKNDSFILEIEKKFYKPTKNLEDNEIKPSDIKLPSITTMEEIENSRIVQKAIKLKKSIQRMSDKEVFALTEPMTVNVHELADNADYFYIVDKNKKITHRVHAKDVIDIKPDIELYEPPRFYTKITKPKNVSPYDKDLSWFGELSGGVTLNSSQWIADLLDDPEAQNGAGFQLRLQGLADMGDQFRLGISTTLENNQYSGSTSKIQTQNLSVGVIGKTKPLEFTGFPSRFLAEVRYSLMGNITQRQTNTEESFQFRSTTLMLGWEKLHFNSWGEWSWGVAFQRDWPKLVNQDVFVNMETNNPTNDSFIINFTQGIAW
jgi:hypothetical protein